MGGLMNNLKAFLDSLKAWGTLRCWTTSYGAMKHYFGAIHAIEKIQLAFVQFTSQRCSGEEYWFATLQGLR
ncbi:hypothetical protein AMTR_s00048p00232010 [Amborella trichopoda]|uniref:Uncharacterized protein n=1 Tax=Amborella trichopoda TaxID=13333 RepID=U5D0E5_AMBTC|nr:hypothetical protein AMTR_s00048p00232010 [Amborella trichopoda]